MSTSSMSICPCNFMAIILYLIAYRLQCFINVSISCWISAPMVDLKKSLFLVPLILIPSIGTQKIIKCGGDKISWLHESPSDNLLYRWGAVLPLWQCQHPVSWKRRENVWCDLLESLQWCLQTEARLPTLDLEQGPHRLRVPAVHNHVGVWQHWCEWQDCVRR